MISENKHELIYEYFRLNLTFLDVAFVIISKSICMDDQQSKGWTNQISFIYNKFLAPKSKPEDMRRREFILNIILVSSLFFMGFLIVTALYNSLTGNPYSDIAVIAFSAVFLAFLVMYIISRSGFFILAAYLFIGVYFIVTSYSAYRWGSYLPSTLLNYILLIIVSSILIRTRFGFFITGIVSVLLGVLGYREITRGVNFTHFWQDKTFKVNDIGEFIITFFVIMVISWLSNREIEKSLRRAKESEVALATERDNLEIVVEQRTQKLKQLQTERVTELHRLAESGRQAAGYFHDLMNPLTAIAASVHDLKTKAPAMAENVATSLDQALTASKRMENFIEAIRRQSKSEEQETMFSLNSEIKQAILLLQHKAKQTGVEMEFISECNIEAKGKPLHFYQIVVNLLSNAIEAYSEIRRNKKKVEIKLSSDGNAVIIKVSDQGKGIPQEVQRNIFDHFFTTKHQEGMGLGLAIAKNIIENDFHGTINVVSSDSGSCFFVVFPTNSSFRVEQTVRQNKDRRF